MTKNAELGGRCGDTHPAPVGVFNQGRRGGVWAGTEYETGPCENPTTNTLSGKPLCKEHWVQGLEARKATDARMAGYRGQLRNYQR